MFAASAVLRASPGGFSFCYRSAAGLRAMSDLAAGKKAAAVKAVNDWVKVGRRITCTQFSYRLALLLHFSGQAKDWDREWLYHCICRGEAGLVTKYSVESQYVLFSLLQLKG